MFVINSFLVNVISFVIGLVTFIVIYYRWTFQYWQKKNMPYLNPTIPFGNIENPLRRKVHNTFRIQRQYKEMKANGWKHGGLFRILTPIYLVLDLEYVKNIMTKDFHHFADRGFYYNEKDDPLSANLFAIGGQKWRNLRTKMSPIFTSGKMKMMFQTLLNCEANLVAKIEADCDTKTPVDVKDTFGCFTIDTIGSCAFGLDCNTFKEENSPFREYSRKAFTLTKFHLLKILLIMTFPNLAKAVEARIILKDVSDFYIKIVKDMVSHRENYKYTRPDFIQLLIELKNNTLASAEDYKHDENTLTIEEIAAQCFSFFTAGFEPSSTTMTFALYELARNQDLQQKVRDEINTVLARYDGKITHDAIQEMTFMDRVIKETLRMYPPVPNVTRKCVLDYKIPDDNIVIEKGTDVLIPLHAIHYDEDYYNNPEKFEPDRFTEENKKKRHHHAYIPFGAGPRICIGMRFALMQCKVGLASLFKNFKFTINKKTQQPLKMKVHSFVLISEEKIWLDVERV